jgi:mannose-6-phosphate isomerase-like protein (cupin superfamily)
MGDIMAGIMRSPWTVPRRSGYGLTSGGINDPEGAFMADIEIPKAPVEISQAISALLLAQGADAQFTRDGERADVEYRNLGLASATGGRIGATINRALTPFEKETGWHWHDLTFHGVYVLKGWLTFRFKGKPGEVTAKAGDFINQPPGVPHNVVGRSTDLEVLEITMPAKYGTYELKDG